MTGFRNRVAPSAEPEWLDGPGLVEWLRENGMTSPDVELGSLARRIGAWRKGCKANVFTADEVLTRLGLHLSELPDDLWTTSPHQLRSNSARAAA